MPFFKGQIKELIYRNEENGYSVIDVKPKHGASFTAVGVIPFAEEGDYVELSGEWTQHSSYGEQLKVTSFGFCEPDSLSAVEKYLSSGAISGIGKETANRIIKKFGDDTLRILDTQPERLTEISGIGRKKAAQIIESYNMKRASQSALMYLMSLGISPGVSMKIYASYERDTVAIIRTQPYRIADEIRGIGFRTADKIALAEGYSLNDERRIMSGIKYVLNESLSGDGHTFLPINEFLSLTSEMLSVSEETTHNALMKLVLKNELVLEEWNDTTAVYLKSAYECEAYIAHTINNMLIAPKPKNDMGDIAECLSDGTRLSEDQIKALGTALSENITVITGGPGTGKTTLIRGIIDAIAQKGEVTLCAPTGRAAKRMSEATGREAKTIHRLLEYGQGDNSGFGKNEDDKLKTDAVIVDEMSMVDIFLMRALLKALPKNAKLILTGDADQLPSVGAGNVLKDLIASGTVPVVRLTEVFRQSGQSAIVMNAHRINRGEMPLLNAKNSDFFMEKQPDAALAAQSVVELVTRRLNGYMGLNPIRDIQVMSPMKKGEAGVIALNRLLQERLNPSNSKKQLARGDTVFRVGDKVMQTKNDYSLGWFKNGEAGQGVFNGDIGRIKGIDTEEKTLTVLFDDDREAKYDRDMTEEIDLAYCMSVHKSQGSEFPCVVMPLVSGPAMLMTRNLLYTAVTRAKKLVVLTGRPECVMSMVKNDHIQERHSSLSDRLRRAAGVV